MNMQTTIETLLQEALVLEHLEVVNESHKHGGAGTQTHFKLTVVAAEFEGVGPVKRHQRLYGLLTQPLENGVHALALHTYTPTEWAQKHRASPLSPDCMGGSH